jgi:hypothetical protein
MKNVLVRISVGIVCSLALFAFWRCGVWLDSLMTMRTPLFFTLHSWASAIVSPFAGVLAAVLYEPNRV